MTFYENNPYLMTTTNSNSRSAATRYQCLYPYTSNPSQPMPAKFDNQQQHLQTASLSYTISESKIGDSNQGSLSNPNKRVTSAPNLQNVPTVLQSRQEVPEKPYSNRNEDREAAH